MKRCPREEIKKRNAVQKNAPTSGGCKPQTEGYASSRMLRDDSQQQRGVIAAREVYMDGWLTKYIQRAPVM